MRAWLAVVALGGCSWLVVRAPVGNSPTQSCVSTPFPAVVDTAASATTLLFGIGMLAALGEARSDQQTPAMLMAGAGFGAAFAFALSAGHGFKESAACREITSPEARAAAVERERRETEQKRAAAAAETTRVHLQDLRKQAKTAARANDCATTRDLAARARELDDGYFHTFIAADPDLAPCLSPEPASP